MAYPIRHFDPQTIFFITSRTIQSRFLMAPSDKTNELIGGILARAVRQCQVELFAYVFTSNHFHAMVRAPSPVAMSRFMQRLCTAHVRRHHAHARTEGSGGHLGRGMPPGQIRLTPFSVRRPR